MDTFDRHNTEVLVVNCGGDRSILDTCVPATRHAANIRCINIAADEFNRSLAINVGVSHCSGHQVLLLDADIILESDLIAEATDLIAEEDCIVKVRYLRESQRAKNTSRRPPFVTEQINTNTFITADGRTASLRTFRYPDGGRCGSGLLCFKREYFIAVEGFNSRLRGWGYEDLDFQLRVQFVLGVKLLAAGRVLHLTHADDSRHILGASRHTDYELNMRTCFNNYERQLLNGTLALDLQQLVY